MIVESRIAVNDLQTDGRRNIIEIHFDDQGGEQSVNYAAEEGVDIVAKMTDRAAEINEQQSLLIENAAEINEQRKAEISKTIEELQSQVEFLSQPILATDIVEKI